MIWEIKSFIILVLVINIIASVNNNNITTNIPIPVLNLLFICSDNLLGSTLMRGDMMKDALNALGMNADTIYLKTIINNINSTLLGPQISNLSVDLQIKSFASSYGHLDACIFVKHYYDRVSNVCKELNAIVLLDMIDDDFEMYLFYEMIHLYYSNDANIDNNHKLQTLMNNVHDVTWLMQTDYLTNFANQIGIKSYRLPHPHSNLNKWGLSTPVYRYTTGLVVGILYGNDKNKPDVRFILKDLCKINVELWLINQQIRGDVDGLKVSTSSRIEYKCIPYNNTQDKDNNITRLFSSNRTFSDEDIYGQAVYYNDAALHGIDIGLLLPRKRHNSDNVSGLVINNVDMLRPQTRFLHWLSRGVPTLYYPTKAYKELAAKYNYGHSVDMELSVITAKDILKAVKLLQSYKRRQSLSIEGLAIAENYKTQNIASNLISIIQEVQMKSNRTSSRKYISKQAIDIIARRHYKKHRKSWIFVTGCTSFLGFHLIHYLFHTNIICIEHFDAYIPSSIRLQRIKHLQHLDVQFGFIENYDDSNTFILRLLEKYKISIVIHLHSLPHLLHPPCYKLNTYNQIMNIKLLINLLDVITGINDRKIEFYYVSNTKHLFKDHFTPDKQNNFFNKMNNYINNSKTIDNQIILNSPVDEMILKLYNLKYNLKYTVFQIAQDDIYGPWNYLNIFEETEDFQLQSSCSKQIGFNSKTNLTYIDDAVNAMKYFIQKSIDNYVRNSFSDIQISNTRKVTFDIESNRTDFNMNVNYWLSDKSIAWKHFPMVVYMINHKFIHEFIKVENNTVDEEISIIPTTSISLGTKQMVRWYQSYTALQYDCSSECIQDNLCTKTKWSSVLLQSRALSENCNVVIYTIVLNIHKNNFPNTSYNFLKSHVCGIAFIMGREKVKYRKWETVNLDSLENPEVHLKLSPRSFFSLDVKFAIYINSDISLLESPLNLIKLNASIIALRDSNITKLNDIPFKKKKYIRNPKHFKHQIQYYEDFANAFNIDYNNIIDTKLLVYDLHSIVGHEFRCKVYHEALQWNEFDFISSSTYILALISNQFNDKFNNTRREWNIIGMDANHRYEYIRILDNINNTFYIEPQF